MSSSGEDFDLEVSASDSEGYTPIKKKPATSKPAAKPKAAPKKKPLSDMDTNAEESMAIDNDSDDEKPSTSAVIAPPKKNKTASEMYQKLSQLEHILKRPDSYIGSVEAVRQAMWVYDSDSNRMVNREVKFVPGFFKIVDEILVNAADNKINDPNMDTLKVNIDVEEGTISVYNNGKGIPIEIHSKEKIYIPELIFGHLLSSSNYDDDEKKLTGGRNGYGAKLANIYSHEFTVETADKNMGKKYKQTWTDNMGKVGKAKITSGNQEYTKVTFKPDFERFGMDGIDDDTLSLLKRRVYDLAGTVKNVKVYLNDKQLKIKNFKQYVEMYLNSVAEHASETSGGAAQAKSTVIYEQINPRFEVAFALSDTGNFQQVSFANSIATTKGGRHVDLVADQIAKNLLTQIEKKNKGAKVKPATIKNHMWIFVNALVENPTFDSQTKDTLTLAANKFGTKPVVSEDFMKKIAKSSIIDHVLNWAQFQADKQAKKTDGSKRSRLTGLPKLSDANNAGGRNAKDCTLILTEGDSAKALAVAGLSVVGRDNFGVFPLRGKLLNVREARHDQVMKNEEIQNIKKIMGLQHNKEYADRSSLRYGQLMIMTDQDHDGSHIKGLLINYLDHFYPSLLKIPNFLVEFVTPIVRVTKGKERKDFFTIPEYERWLENTPDSHKWESKYYKGLGTSKDSDAMDYFSHMEKHMIPFATTQDGDRELIDLAFSKKKADDRKEWLRQCRPGTYLNHDVDEIPYSDFINKELILFSMADNIRSIPSVADGLKPGQRKVIWGCFRRKLKKEIKVAQLVGYIAEHAAYHHGEQSLMATIVNLAQDYVGSNNLNLLMPNGQYGTREQGGKDHASARYIFTEPSPIARAIFHQQDDPLLNYLKDDNDPIEPEWYMPVLPLVLINGAEGIGTGWSTSIPSYNPVDIVENIRRLMRGEEMVPMMPWWRGFRGTVKKVSENRFDVTGVIRKKDETTIEITELPIHKWTQNYKAELEAMIGEKGDGLIKDYKEHHNNINVHFVINTTAKDMEKIEKEKGGLEEYFKMTTKINTSNMICFDFEGKIRKYNTPEEIIEEFYPMRLAYYQKRKDFMANELQLQFEKLSNQARFVQMIVDRELSVSNRKKADIVAELRKREFRPFPKVAKAKAAGENAEVVEDADELEEVEREAQATGAGSDYDYLLGMPIYALTKEKIEKLRQQMGDKEAELLTLLERTPIEIWNEDLDKFLEELSRNNEEWERKGEVDASGKKVKKKQGAKLRTRKSLPGPGKRKGDDDDSEDDWKPTKAKAAESKPKPGTIAAMMEKRKEKNAAASGSGVKKEDKEAKKEEDDDDEPVVVPTKRATTKKKPAYVEADEDSDIEMMDVKPKTASKPAPKAKKAVKEESDDEDVKPPSGGRKGKAKAKEESDDDDGDFALGESKKVTAGAKAKGKRKSVGSEEEESDAYVKPAPKKAKATLNDFFDDPPAKAKAPTARKASGTSKVAAMKSKASSSPTQSKPKSKAAPVKKAPAKKKAVVSDDDDDDDIPVVVAARTEAPKRTARAAAKKATYVDILSDEDDGGADDSLFHDDD
ncbi:type II DNA topoisomerase [Punctularia strigosozonata HHB-11173 SS5]|uniref:type II DNA topoisomerase n=1 Tax=Punctularia strigosozonata (strain HHB-11173) TaxID=741275 RepID=UPI00044162FE|nr:type II DNA topoisomerase [Punctularia strigosozonata HHB-11173 SS5]EIN13330.1 type II DNA topoisomerase [Punctularia strigosozonata HHB-11173 SS5]